MKAPSALAVVVLLLGACTGADSDEGAIRATAPEAGDHSLAGIPGRLLVLGPEGSITTMAPDGSQPMILAAPVEEVEQRTQPTWSPQGDRVAWTERRTDAGASLVVAEGDGQILSTTPSPLLAGYLAWDPEGAQIAMSGNDEEGNLLLATTRPGEGIEVIDGGSPLYFDWAPDGSGLLVHIEGRLEHLTVDGLDRRSVTTDGDFRMGAHLGDSIVMGTQRDIGETLVLADQTGRVERELLRYAAPMAFVISPDNDRLAVLSRGSADSQALHRVEGSELPILEPNRLMIVDAVTGRIEEVAEGQGVAWFWSPGGSHLLYSTLEIVDAAQALQWHTWDGQSSTSFRAFTPTGVFGRDYLAFFDQFARSISLWAPDGSAFVYAGGSSLDDVGIWVQRLDEEDPVRVTAGEAALWSPTP